MDAIVLIPAADDETLWYALAAVIETGIFVVAIDTKPPNQIYRDIGVEAPRFVSTRYDQTGVIAGEILERFLEEDDERTCVLWIGPDGSWPGEERSRHIVYRLTRDDLYERVSLMPISSWTPEPIRCRETLAVVRRARGPVAIYCADDENAMALHLLCLTEAPELRPRMYIIGCNATADDWGNIPAIDMRAVEATVDILAEPQGTLAAQLLIKERCWRLQASERSSYIKPKALLRAYSADRWLDELFASDDPDRAPASDSTLADPPVVTVEVDELVSADHGQGGS